MPISSPSYFPPQRYDDRIIGLNAGIGQTGNYAFLAGLNAGTWTTQADLIVIGSSAFSAGTKTVPNNDDALAGTIAIGANALAVCVAASEGGTGPPPAEPNVAIGTNALASCESCSANVVIGNQAMATYSSTNGSLGNSVPAYNLVVIGQNALQYATIDVGFAAASYDAVVIGANALNGTVGGSYISVHNAVVIGQSAVTDFPAASAFTLSESVVIGDQACSGFKNTNGGTDSNSVYIGFGVAPGVLGSGTGNNTFIGGGAGTGYANPNRCIAIGQNSQVGSSNSIAIGSDVNNGGFGASAINAIGIGNSVSVQSRNSTVLGDSTDATFNLGAISLQSARSVWIGAGAGYKDASATGTTATDTFLCEVNDGTNGKHTILYGDMSTGNLLVGNSLAGTNRELHGTNTLKMIAGTKDAVDPVGGYFYLTGTNNDLHFVNSAGVDINVNLGALGVSVYDYQVPASGFAITIPNGTKRLVLNPAATLAAGTVTMPAAPYDGQEVGISSTQVITALTLSPNTGQTIADAITTIGVGGAATFLYNATTAAWYRVAN